MRPQYFSRGIIYRPLTSPCGWFKTVWLNLADHTKEPPRVDFVTFEPSNETNLNEGDAPDALPSVRQIRADRLVFPWLIY